MIDGQRLSAPSDTPSQMTVAQYVRENFRPVASKFMWWAIIAVPGSIAIKTRGSHFSMVDRGLMILAAWLIAAIAIVFLVSACLSISAWWKIHTKVSPYVPVTILMVAAVLGCYWVMHYY